MSDDKRKWRIGVEVLGLIVVFVLATVVTWQIGLLVWGPTGYLWVRVAYIIASLVAVTLIGLFGVGWWSGYLPQLKSDTSTSKTTGGQPNPESMSGQRG